MTPTSLSATMTLDAVVARLAQHPQIDGLVLVGSAQGAHVPVYADYDLVIVLAANPLRLHVGVTTIDGRLTDLIFVERSHVQAILAASEPIDPGAWTGRLVAWLQEGSVLFDRRGDLTAAQEKAMSTSPLRPLDASDVTQACFGLNYNVAQTARLLASDDPVYQLAALVRMQWFGVGDLLAHYLTIRRQPWRGEKAALRYLQAHDPAYLARFQRFMHANDAAEKFAHYRQLAADATAPAGGLWPEHATVFQLGRADAGAELPVTAAEAFWTELIQGESTCD